MILQTKKIRVVLNFNLTGLFIVSNPLRAKPL